MKSLIAIVLAVVVAIAAYTIINKPVESEVVENVTEEAAMPSAPASEQTMTEETEVNMITPADMPEKAQDEMYGDIMEYNKCMMQNRLEYHQKGVRIEKVADKTLAACEPHLDELRVVLETNNVNESLTEGMIKTMRQRAARKLMGNVMSSMAGQAAAAANGTPVTPTQVVTP